MKWVIGMLLLCMSAGDTAWARGGHGGHGGRGHGHHGHCCGGHGGHRSIGASSQTERDQKPTIQYGYIQDARGK